MFKISYFLTGTLALCSSLPFSSNASPDVNCEQFSPEQLNRVRYLSPQVSIPKICELQIQTQACSKNQLSGWAGNYRYLSCREVSADEVVLPLMPIDDLVYRGGFRLSPAISGPSPYATLSYSSGVMTYNPANNSLFIVGHPYENGIAEFAIPRVVSSANIEDFIVGDNVLQSFNKFYNTERIDLGTTVSSRISGLQLIDGQLVVNYMAPNDGKLKKTSVVFTNAANLAESQINGPYELDGALHASGWVSEIPEFWQAQLGGTHLSGAPDSTFTYGPTAFAFNPRQHMLSGQSTGSVPSSKLFDFSSQQILQESLQHNDNLSNSAILANQDGLNELWTSISRVAFGVLIPDTSTYLTIGYSGGHHSGTSVDHDKYAYYWLWDVNDLISVKNGQKQLSELLPYDHGEFDLPVGHKITGGTFDEATGSLYLALSKADQLAKYARVPLFLKYQLKQFDPGYANCANTSHGEYATRQRFESPVVAYDKLCSSISEQQTSICSDGQLGSWSGSYQYTSCTVANPPLPPSSTINLVTMDILEYAGGFRISGERFGDARTASYSSGVMVYNPERNSIFLVGHDKGSNIGEFAIPELVNSTDIRQFNVITESLQDFSQFNNTDRVNTGVPKYFRYTGLAVIQGQLVANYVHWYDTAAQKNTTIVIKDASDLANSEVKGPYQLNGIARSAGWITEIPDNWQARLGGTYITGGSQIGIAITSRLSVGPAAFVFTPEQDLLPVEPAPVDTLGLLDFPYHKNILFDKSIYGESIETPQQAGDILYNKDQKSDLWNILAGAAYGFIIPGTDTYMTVGRTSGIDSQITYKGGQSNGRRCGGPCAYNPDDVHNYYWLWNVNDLQKVKNGDIAAYEVRPYDYGKFEIPVDLELSTISGATYDSNNQLLYLSFSQADKIAAYARPPVFLAFKLNH